MFCRFRRKTKQNDGRNQDEMKLLDCCNVVRCDEGVVRQDKAKVPQLKKLLVCHDKVEQANEDGLGFTTEKKPSSGRTLVG